MKNHLLLLEAMVMLALPAAGQSISTASARPAPAGASARPAAPLSADEQLFTTLINRLGTAVDNHDMVALGKFMAPEYVHHNPDNKSSTRAEELAYISTWGKTGVKLISPVQVNRYGNTAVTVATCTFSSTFEGKPNNTTLQMMIAWVLRGESWQMVVMQSKVVPA